jgi:hypothetical protein
MNIAATLPPPGNGGENRLLCLWSAGLLVSGRHAGGAAGEADGLPFVTTGGWGYPLSCMWQANVSVANKAEALRRRARLLLQGPASRPSFGARLRAPLSARAANLTELDRGLYRVIESLALEARRAAPRRAQTQSPIERRYAREPEPRYGDFGNKLATS